ncbi:hypothetical protein [Pseudobacteriovorax antillogorgiicola]|uniref:Uncharacterized protein n=1 Tax=Pseudobacteriovorax antillogorgiicola TaxID=1513793 RepID=A0A1Y6BGJ5_9BACT|nr:hypothetical protein [Pseudobacteriovorax antillogorgiicola]TCS57491.1 hypothetical protein EDD56_103231 [Pseudobacteriovorax antillogorgiicola]SMF00472.1 hypothetical protein SAMN06296036_103102 [Pseudobacteriovorax antillogorgiicola]
MQNKEMGRAVQKMINLMGRHRDPESKALKKNLLLLKQNLHHGKHRGLSEQTKEAINQYDKLKPNQRSRQLKDKFIHIYHQIQELERLS